ncbi:type II toxin-antitoxin system RnlA family toxin [Paraburkholderia sp. J76]|uniref:type II toxin-antitoxin system RnlA family toxin n=1 Tax=Paraburkholderia sp. J76 TaxID=2805439 RepID=UPI002ABDA280|nr:type II toxin-antitoxin system RnlA family toxin [Paraburkholderia sp. J76]
MATSSFTGLYLKREKIADCLVAFGAEKLAIKDVRDQKHFHYSGELAGTPFLINVFANKDGSTTLGFSKGDRNVFDVLATEVRDKCSYSDKNRFDVSIPKMDASRLAKLKDFLAGGGVELFVTEKGSNYELTRYRGINGDVVTVKLYTNGTLQFQGKYAQVAALVMDFLQGELTLTTFVEKQIAICHVDIKAEAIVDELKARYPSLFDYADDKVKKQFSAALTLQKLDIELEDFSAVAFPALRGLEGIIKQMLIDAGLKPAAKDAVGQYFEQPLVGKWQLLPVNASHVGAHWADVLGNAYTEYYKHRHPLFHMESMVETTKILDSLKDACDIADNVMKCAEVWCQKVANL